MKNFILLSAAAISISAAVIVDGDPKKAPDNWYNLSMKDNKVFGVQTEKTYNELLKGKTPDTIIVAVMDGGVDYTHEDLKSVMWVNKGEIAGNGVDDDKNGYVDDVHGWNFIGGKNGENVNYDNLELVRLLRDKQKLYKGKDSTDIPSSQREDFREYLSMKKDYDAQVKEMNDAWNSLNFINMYFKDIAKSYKKDSATYEDYKNWEPGPQYEKVHKRLKLFIRNEESYKEFRGQIAEGRDQVRARLDYHLNMDYDSRTIVGDNYENADEKYYGNGDIKGPNAVHGTHVAGIIAADRNNNLGVLGVASAVKIMGVRVVPDGDERDKDVANGIYYSVDNGAKIINMSFGKSYGYNKAIVDKAIKYAESKGVLIVHAAGNDNKDNDKTRNFPNPRYLDGGVASNWVEVGALSWKSGKHQVAPFSNYGQKNVDVFAPGVDIYNCKSNGGYVALSGTSMASPVVAGCCAVIKSYFPDKSPADIKKIIEESSDKSMAKKKVILPGEKKKKVKFGTLSRTGGVVNLYSAVQMAMGAAK